MLLLISLHCYCQLVSMITTNIAVAVLHIIVLVVPIIVTTIVANVTFSIVSLGMSMNIIPSGSKNPIFEDSGPKSHSGIVLEPETLNIGYLNPLGIIQSQVAF